MARLRAVSPDDAPQTQSRSVADAAKRGSQRELLVAMRDRIAITVSNPDCPARDLASLTKRLQDIARDIEAIDARCAQETDRGEVEDETFDASAI